MTALAEIIDYEAHQQKRERHKIRQAIRLEAEAIEAWFDAQPDRESDVTFAQYAAKKAEWRSKYGHHFPSLYEIDCAWPHHWISVSEQDAWQFKYSRKEIPLSVIPFPVPATQSAEQALPLTFFDECSTPTPKKWLVKGVVAKGENSSVFGAPGSLKSAMLTDIAVHTAAGKDWRGFKHKERAGVVYFAFERADQVRRRLSAYAKRDGMSGLPMAVTGQIVDMLNPSCVDIIVQTVRAAEARFGMPVGVIVIDTWSKGIAAGGGDEDKARDQNIVAANLRRIHELLDVHIAGVGHSGKDETRGERGSNARQGDVDLQIHITGDAVKTATVIKANDQPEGALTSFAGEVVNLGVDEDGDAVTAFILSMAAVAAPKATSRLSDRQVLALDALKTAIKEHGQAGAVAVDRWRDELFRIGVLDIEAKNPREPFRRLRDALARSQRIAESDGMVRIGMPTLGPSPLIGQLPG
ncbi:AAA family ATPase [Pseudorhodoplanes sinuspersici]|uniref:Uncharacterized protein n=1 Tax=Pseudorhodoplanes sinuspersici TaxID=1235591 RepID=A0A1W6ZWL9_9HYPH|nr:AAA family ATPase [Pseudorhodoplanes sinuspersici]ARQ01710.1 hypothetical protein CAK95_23355 [Pseudorhodoplanes sinuspersici]RKE73442.1 AAA domain-containing protein [Pseudorhodoplanes sinuspersici]